MRKKRLKIATVVASEVPFPVPRDFPRPYAPLQVALDIAEGLTKKGHRVTFFGPKGSRSKVFDVKEADFKPLYKNKILSDPFMRTVEQEKIFHLFDQYLIALLFEENRKQKFDIIHIHPADRALPFAYLSETPVVYTLHDPVYSWRKEIFELYKTKNQYFISISKFQQKAAPKLNWIATVYNGINLASFPFNERPQEHCLFSGRLLPRKGPYEAILAAKKAKKELIIVGSREDKKYWENKIKPNLTPKIKYRGLIPYEDIYKYYSKAEVSLFPILWDEPFGLVFIESMACGTPVIAFNKGSAKEIIKNGETGFIVENVNEMAQAIKKIDQIDRRACRRWVEQNFTTEKMVEGYERAFYEIVA